MNECTVLITKENVDFRYQNNWTGSKKGWIKSIMI
jgi:hypothetical protein